MASAHPPKQQNEMLNAIKDILSGTMGGFAQVAAGHPLDTVKVRLATQDPKNPKFAGMVDCFRKTFAQEGAAGLYKGAASPLAGAVFHNANLFFAYGQARRFLGAKSDTDPINLTRTFAAGAIAGCLVSVVEGPIDLLKIKLQSQVGTGQYKGVFDAARKITGSYGLKGLYQGTVPTIMRNTPAFAGYFWGFEAVKRMLTPQGQTPSLTTCFIAGGAGGFGFWGFIYPIELIKTRIQSDSLVPSEKKYSGVVDCFRKTLQAEGWRGLFRGYVPAIVRAVPVNACIFLAVTASKRAMNKQAAGGSAKAH